MATGTGSGGELFGDDPFERGGRAERAPAEDDAPRLFTVGELTRAIGGALDKLGRVRVEGEISRVTRAASGHVYFDLKDIDAKLACTLWKSAVATSRAPARTSSAGRPSGSGQASGSTCRSMLVTPSGEWNGT